jgi:hypothetical protein
VPPVWLADLLGLSPRLARAETGLAALGGALLQERGWSGHRLSAAALLAVAGVAAVPRPAPAALGVLPILSLQERASWPPPEMPGPGARPPRR